MTNVYKRYAEISSIKMQKDCNNHCLEIGATMISTKASYGAQKGITFKFSLPYNSSNIKKLDAIVEKYDDSLNNRGEYAK
jgi:hypothetical protein